MGLAPWLAHCRHRPFRRGSRSGDLEYRFRSQDHFVRRASPGIPSFSPDATPAPAARSARPRRRCSSCRAGSARWRQGALTSTVRRRRRAPCRRCAVAPPHRPNRRAETDAPVPTAGQSGQTVSPSVHWQPPRPARAGGSRREMVELQPPIRNVASLPDRATAGCFRHRPKAATQDIPQWSPASCRCPGRLVRYVSARCSIERGNFTELQAVRPPPAS